MLSRDEFKKLLKEGFETPVRGKADWDRILKELKRVHRRKTAVPLTISQIYQNYVKGVVSRFRTRKKLEEWRAQGVCTRVFYKGQWYYWFGPIE